MLPPFLGYNTIRVGRPTTKRLRGLLTLVYEDIVSRRVTEGYSPPLERLTIKIQLSRRRRATIHNPCEAPVKEIILTDVLP